MQKMTATKTRTGQESIHLSALSQAGDSNSSAAAPWALNAPPEPFLPLRASIAESYDGEIRQATRSRFIPVEPVNSQPLRVKTRWILKNGISRRTLHVTILFGIVGTIYYGVSLIPPFRGLRYQGESNANNRQTMAYSFLQECATRKLQNLPLGQDCIKYLAMTPKAPPDIDLYVVNPPVSNTKKTHLLIRHSIFAAKKMIIKRSPMLGSTVPRYDGSAAGLLAGHEFAIAIFILALIYIFHPQLKYILVEIFWLSTRPYTRGFLQKPTPTILMCQLAVWIVTLVTTVYTLLLLYQALFYMPTGWAATSEFLTTCKALQDTNLAFGPDCAKYLTMELKPDPTSNSEALFFSAPNAMLRVVLTLGVLIILFLHLLVAYLVFKGVTRRAETSSVPGWSFSYEDGLVSSGPRGMRGTTYEDRPVSSVLRRMRGTTSENCPFSSEPLELQHFQGPPYENWPISSELQLQHMQGTTYDDLPISSET